eukprot:CAMPEP_0180171452 /NCGR_PEP_ID=MMETSP0986-20121125/34432_1 /TAXON_ID=697907 /ORGANISM="non described non described, Strain CCMP2293" /LENGTH=70 /DNA_ID=CAMNT_0022123339 /DNA_START=41 /DNA_END=253 /DNA_ORIENTATION=+
MLGGKGGGTCWSESCLNGSNNWSSCAPNDDICIATDGTSNGDTVKGYGTWNVDDVNGFGHWYREGVMAPN